jgi:hypothetical protein
MDRAKRKIQLKGMTEGMVQKRSRRCRRVQWTSTYRKQCAVSANQWIRISEKRVTNLTK